MNNFVRNRIIGQINSAQTKSIKSDRAVEKTEVKRNPLSPEELKKVILDELLRINPVIKPNMVFDGIESFVGWYLVEKDKFNEPQQIAFSTLVQARNMINAGCSCKREYRLSQANEYFQNFWIQNEKTDLPSKVLEVGGFDFVSFTFRNIEFLRLISNKI